RSDASGCYDLPPASARIATGMSSLTFASARLCAAASASKLGSVNRVARDPSGPSPPPLNASPCHKRRAPRGGMGPADLQNRRVLGPAFESGGRSFESLEGVSSKGGYDNGSNHCCVRSDVHPCSRGAGEGPLCPGGPGFLRGIGDRAEEGEARPRKFWPGSRLLRPFLPQRLPGVLPARRSVDRLGDQRPSCCSSLVLRR